MPSAVPLRFSHPLRRALVAGAILLSSCDDLTPVLPRAPGPHDVARESDSRILAAGDISGCDTDGDERTARLLDTLPGTVLTLGDNVYPAGALEDFDHCYAPTWGRHKARTRPVPGNHDYATAGAAGYFTWFGNRAPGPYYSFDVATWHLIALNSNLAGDQMTEQLRWLHDDLAATNAPCVLAYWHHPRFSSGPHGSDLTVGALWDTLARGGADLVLAGHDHLYERFAPLGPAGIPDAAHGVREFVVGTGGRSHYGVVRPLPASEVRIAATFGVLALDLGAGRYAWRFVTIEGAVADSGSAACH